jgi:hypothetical protein
VFAGAAHLWASFAFLEPHEQEQAFVEIAVFHKLMGTSIFDCFRDHGAVDAA